MTAWILKFTETADSIPFLIMVMAIAAFLFSVYLFLFKRGSEVMQIRKKCARYAGLLFLLSTACFFIFGLSLPRIPFRIGCVIAGMIGLWYLTILEKRSRAAE